MALLVEHMRSVTKLPQGTKSLLISNVAVYQKDWKLGTVHEALEFCLTNGVTDFYVGVDRGADEQTRQTIIRIVMIGKGSEEKEEKKGRRIKMFTKQPKLAAY